MRVQPHLVTVKEKLAAQKQKPEPKRDTQRAARDAVAEKRSANSACKTTGNKLKKQWLAEWMRKPVRAAADHGHNESEEYVCAYHLRWNQRGKAEKRGAAQSTGPGRGEADLGADWEHQPWQEKTSVRSACFFLHRPK